MPDAEKTAAGTRTSAGGVVASKAQKAALGEAMDHQIAGMSKQEKAAKGKGKPKQATSNTPKVKKDTSDAKKLQKAIKQHLNWIICPCLTVLFHGDCHSSAGKNLKAIYQIVTDCMLPQGCGTRAKRPENLHRTWLTYRSPTRKSNPQLF